MNSRTVSVQNQSHIVGSVVKVAQAREGAWVQFLAFVTLIFLYCGQGLMFGTICLIPCMCVVQM